MTIYEAKLTASAQTQENTIKFVAHLAFLSDRVLNPILTGYSKCTVLFLSEELQQ